MNFFKCSRLYFSTSSYLQLAKKAFVPSTNSSSSNSSSSSSSFTPRPSSSIKWSALRELRQKSLQNSTSSSSSSPSSSSPLTPTNISSFPSPAFSRFQFSPRIPLYDPESHLFFVGVAPSPLPLWTRQATAEALSAWFQILGAGAAVKRLESDEIDTSLVQISLQTLDPAGALTPRCRIMKHLFIPEESPIDLPSLENDFHRYCALNPKLQRLDSAVWQYRAQVMQQLGHLASRVLSRRLRKSRLVPPRDVATSREDYVLLHAVDELFIPAVIAHYANADIGGVFAQVAECTQKVSEYWAKQHDAGMVASRNNPVYFCLEYLRILSIVLKPILPNAAAQLHAHFPSTQPTFPFLKMGYLTSRHSSIPYESSKKPFTIPLEISHL